MRTIDEFCGQKKGYSLSKTLRFELKPQGKTLESITTAGLIKEDEQRAKDYQDVKKILDNYHKYFIDDVLKNASNQNLDWEPLKNAILQYQKDKSNEKLLEAEQKKMRTAIVKCFSADKERFAMLTASTPKDLFQKELPEWLKKDSMPNLDNKAIETFKKFATYFAGYQETRKNVYSQDAISTAVPFRIVHDNFPKFLQNLAVFETLTEKCPEVITTAENELTSILGGKKIADFFTINAFNNFLTQTGANEQRGIDFYNQLLGGIKKQDVQQNGINQCINLYWQQHPDFAKENRRIKMIPLYKQILSDRSTLSFVIESIENDTELFEAVTQFNDLITKESNDSLSVLKKCSDLVSNIGNYDQEHLYVNAKNLTNISLALFGRWDTLQIRMNEFSKATFTTKKERARWYKEIDDDNSDKRKGVFSFAELDSVLSFSSDIINATDKRMKDYFETQYKTFFDKEKNEYVSTKEVTVVSVSELIANIQSKWTVLQKIIAKYGKNTLIKDSKDDVATLKSYLDCVNELFARLRILTVANAEARDTEFYTLYDEIIKALGEIMPLYNKARNYISKKAFDVGKYKLNFENPILAGGWPNEIASSCFLLKDKENFYLGILNSKEKKNFKNLPIATAEEAYYEKMCYMQVADPSKDVPNLMVIDGKTVKKNGRKDKVTGQNLILEQLKNDYLPKEINRIRKDRTYLKTSETFNKNDLCQFIDYYKQRTIEYFSTFNFVFKDSALYESFPEFTDDVNSQAYQISFEKISKKFIDEWVETGKLYLFQIYNKDFSTYSNGTPNLHTLYWKNLFSEENLKDVVLKLNGEAELFYRGIGVKKPIIHEVGSKVVNRTTKDGKSIPETIHNEIYCYVNKKGESSLSPEAKQLYESGTVEVKPVKENHELIKDKHYTQEKFLFHVPITINYKASGNSYINENVRKFLSNNPDVNIIGLDRGERHLIYMSIINQKGEIIEQKTFNTVQRTKENKDIAVDYHEKLDQREKERDAARKNWQTIGKIAELKEGYLSAVIHELTTLMIKHNAIIVMEDLNFGFKRGRFHVEKQVYQKFEHMLIDKLNYLVFKDKGLKEAGGVLNGYQLAGVFESFQKLGKQSGFLFYVPAAYTSKIDPQTGFVNMLDMSNLTNVQKKREFFSKFNSISYDEAKQMFAFDFDYKNFNGKGAEEMFKTAWTVYSNGERIQFCGKGNPCEHICVTSKLKELFEQNQIDYQSGNNILDTIMENGADLKPGEKPSKDVAAFWDKLLSLFKLILQMRNSDARTGDDYIISPVMANNGSFFDSREQLNTEKAKLPCDADANGAYHIALKGLYLIKQFDKIPTDELKKVDMKIKNADWFRFTQEKKYRN